MDIDEELKAKLERLLNELKNAEVEIKLTVQDVIQAIYGKGDK